MQPGFLSAAAVAVEGDMAEPVAHLTQAFSFYLCETNVVVLIFKVRVGG